MLMGDFHVHSQWSDGRLSLSQLVDMYGERGFGVVAITDHLCEKKSIIDRAAHLLNKSLRKENFTHYMEKVQEEAERAWTKYRMVVLPGYEITKNSFNHHRSAHILAIGITEYIDPELDIVFQARRIRELGGIAIAAHPVDTGKIETQTRHLWDRREELKTEFDAWEVASGPVLFDPVMKSGLPMIASSDLHLPSQMTSWKTMLQCEKRADIILEAIRKQELEFRFYEAVSNKNFIINSFEHHRVGTGLIHSSHG
jgi:predicted metal-dependent phosphoesterase TrpH